VKTIVKRMHSSQAENCLKALSRFQRRISFERDNELAGYTIRIYGLTYESDKELVRQIAKSLNLKIIEETDSISIL
jgi:hypothetical protein